MALEKRNLYRLPWSLNDNPIAWIEVTDLCNLHCEGCYRQQLSGHKPLAEIREEILFYKKWRNPDNLSIAGGEPLLHPQILDIVALAAQNRIKPIILTNAMALTPELLRELKRAGLAGFTIHIDSRQDRPQWRGKSEAELNELRQRYADLVAAERGLYVIFNSTVYPNTLAEVPEVVRWGQANIDRVHGVVFITYRTTARDGHLARDLAGQEVDLGRLSYIGPGYEGPPVTGPELCRTIQERFPLYQPCAYLGGTVLHSSFKWLLAACIGTRRQVFGAIGPRTMEAAQAGHHWLKGTYLAYLTSAAVGAKVFLLSPWDPAVRRAAGRWLRAVARRPWRLGERLHIQSIAIIQAPDLQPDGRVDMCDSCPDMTYYNGALINSCRMDEYRLFGGPITVLGRGEDG